MAEKTLQIRGMTCAACASSIEKVLNKLDGVEELKETVRDIGYGVGEQKIKFDVSA